MRIRFISPIYLADACSENSPHDCMGIYMDAKDWRLGANYFIPPTRLFKAK